MIYVDTSPKTSRFLTVVLLLILGVMIFFIGKIVIDSMPKTPAEPSITGPSDQNTEPDEPGNYQTPDTISGTNTCIISPSTSGNYISESKASKRWVLLGKEFTAADKTLQFGVTFNDSAQHYITAKKKAVVTYEVVGTKLKGDISPSTKTDLQYLLSLSVGDLLPAQYTIKMTASLSPDITQEIQCKFYTSYPVYVTWTMDWEGYDVKQLYLDQIKTLSNQYKIPITNFFNPLIYTAPASVISQSRATYLTNWVLGRVKSNGDSIDLHLHMFLDMVKAAGVTPLTSPTWGGNYPDGYNILTSAYNYEDMFTMLKWAKTIFKQKGLPEPKIFRAGGWYASLNTLMVLQDNGFWADSSGRTKYSVLVGGRQGPWDLKATTQPYQPNDYNQNSSAAPKMKLWEFPDNGADSYAFSADQIINRFQQNYAGGVAKSKTTVTFLTHPHWYNIDKPKMEKTFAYVDKYNSKKDSGPVVYINMDNLYKIYAGVK